MTGPPSCEPTRDAADLICLSHLRWNFVFQRPQHLMTRFARERRVFFVEEPVVAGRAEPELEIKRISTVWVVTPRLPEGLAPYELTRVMRTLLDDFLAEKRIDDYLLWYYTPMALQFTGHWTPLVTIYDCMDELSAFKDAPADLVRLEAELMARASLVLTGGHALYEAKQHAHHNIHPVPSSVDVAHFAAARRSLADPADQAGLARPRLGFCGVIDERMDLDLVEGIAAARPDWQIVMVGPVVKISEASLPRRGNLHYLGAKTYEELPRYLANWDVAIMPFARNAATRYISPTKTPEYLAAGRPVVSTSIRDVVRPYGQRGLVSIADDVQEFVQACEAYLHDAGTRRQAEADEFLMRMSWNDTWQRVNLMIDDLLPTRLGVAPGLSAESAAL